MSTRALRLCDKERCNPEFCAVCIFCDVDCCASHLGKDEIQLTVALRRASNGKDSPRLAVARFFICGDCTNALSRQDADIEFVLSNASFEAPIVEAVKAFLATKVLAATGAS